jgi:hypothetical protein
LDYVAHLEERKVEIPLVFCRALRILTLVTTDKIYFFAKAVKIFPTFCLGKRNTLGTEFTYKNVKTGKMEKIGRFFAQNWR